MSKQSDRRPSRKTVRSRTLLFTGASIAALAIVSIIASGNEPDQSQEAIDTTGTPALTVDSDYVDFGDVPFNQMVEAVFEVTNSGDAALLFAEMPFVELKDGC
ncbi:MAG: hypothetical protein P1T08_17670 [Acidimicrobiia bacterium]|nr:hypothetical protein [Acidimicrobiia bacterium]